MTTFDTADVASRGAPDALLMASRRRAPPQQAGRGAIPPQAPELVAKEYVVYNNPRSSSEDLGEDLGEEMVRMLVRVRRHLPRRR